MPTKSVVVGSAVGLHARPAAIISEAAGELDSEVTIAVPGDEPVDASSALLIMTLGAGRGATVEVSATTRPMSTSSPPWSRRTSTPSPDGHPSGRPPDRSPYCLLRRRPATGLRSRPCRADARSRSAARGWSRG